MGYRSRRSFSRDRGSRDRRPFNRGSFDRQRIDRAPLEMHRVVCADCGKECEVPFRPTGDRPVYCSECFAKRRPSETEDRREYRQEGRQRTSSPASEDVNLQILAELRRIREALEKSQPVQRDNDTT
jgi:CxxC-x17-CxxC domain-containing protein